MIRKAIIILLSVTALAVLGISVTNVFCEFTWWPVGDEISLPHAKVWCGGRGWIVVEYWRPANFTFPIWGVAREPSTLGSLLHLAYEWNSGLGMYGTGRKFQSYHLGVRTWPLFILLSAYPVVALIRGPIRRHRRRTKGLCVKCGYNLTGNVSGICPECGERI